MALIRLFALARLTPAQALEIAAGVLAEAARRPEPDDGSSGGGLVTLDQVVVRTDGRVVLSIPSDGSHNGSPTTAHPPGPDVAAVLAAVAAAGRHDRPADRSDDEVPTALDRALTELPTAGVPAVALMLHEATRAIDRETVRAELAALVGAIRTDPGPASGVGAAVGASPTGASSGEVRETATRRATRGRARTARRRIGAWLLSVLVLAGVVTGEVVLLRDKITADIGLLLDAGRGGTTAVAAPVPAPDARAIAAPAPAAAGSVAGVDLRALAPCAPGAPCTVRFLVRLAPGGGRQVVTWTYQFIDRCTGATASARGGSVTVPSGGRRAVAVRIVPLPALQAVAVVAVTDRPAAAASSPVLIGSCAHDPRAK
ncbi:MAG: hypothetical protein ACXVX8_04860 [Blastococcus sp.]